MLSVDSHVHLWRAGTVQTAWLDQPPVAGDRRFDPLRRDFSPRDLEPLLAGAGVGQVVLVQAADALEDTEALLGLARDHAWVLGMVGWLPLADREAFQAGLRRYGGEGALRGLRHLINAEPDPNWVLQRDVVDAIARLGAAGLAFDYVGQTMDHLARLPRLARACPETTIVLDHLNNPPIAAGEWQPWADLLAQAADRPNVVGKISGLETCGDWAAWTLADWRPYLDHALGVFGADRLMLGSNWPVSALASDYGRTWAALGEWLSDLPPDQQAALARGTARRIYGGR